MSAADRSEETVSLARQADRVCDRFEFLLLARQNVSVAAFLRGEGFDPAAADPDLVRELDRLAAYYHADKRPTVAAAGPGDAGGPVVAAGLVLAGRYALVRKIGGGGMGDVWLADQTRPVERRVAVKVIKAGIDSHAVVARFDAERQALAVMRHPNIARVLDGGVHTVTLPGGEGASVGVPFFVMELVDGVPITRFCDDRKLTPRQRLELFVPVCEAIQHAHQKGLIHRDIKPGNVLVAEVDGRPVPMVIDFGIAKAVAGPDADRPAVSSFGAVIGTPAYMSPEQAGGNSTDIDTRSDVYSLGVLLYELLTGGTPVGRTSLDRAALHEVLRVVREVDAPRASVNAARTATDLEAATNRGTEPRKLARLLRGDLDWVLMKALEKDRDRRYESPAALAAEVGRYLRNEPVDAGPPSASYRLKKFVRRNRAPVGGAAAVFGALVAGVVGTTLGLVEADRQRGEAEVARELEVAATALAERNAAAAQTASAEAVAAEGVAVREKRNALAVAASSALDQAQQVCEGGNVIRGLHLMAKALKPAVESGDKALEDAVRGNIAAWLPHANRIVGCAGGAHLACLSPDGTRIVTGNGSGELTFRDAATLAQIGRVQNAGTGILQVAWQPRGDVVAVLGRDGLLRLWKSGTTLARAKSVRVCAPMNEVPRGALSFTPDGTKLLVGCMGRAALLVDVVNEKVVTPSFFHGSTHCDAVAVSPDGTKAVVATPNWSVRVYDLTTGKPLTPTIRTYGCNFCTGISPDGTKFFTGHHMDASLQVWDMMTGAAVGPRIAPGGPVLSAAFSPDGRHLAVGGWMAFVRIWDWKTGKMVGSPIPGDCFSLAFTPDGSRLMINGVGVWQLPDRDLAWTSERLPGSVHGFAIRPDSGELAITMTGAFTRDSDGSQTAFLRRYRIANGEPIRPFLPTTRGRFAPCLRYTPDGGTIYCAQGEGVSEFNLARGREARYLVHPDAKQGYGAMDLSRDGRYLAVSGGHVAVYDRTLAAWTHRVAYNQGGQTAIEYLPGTHTLVDFSGGKLLAWDIDAAPFAAREQYDSGLGYCTRANISNDGSTVAVMNSGGNLAEHEYATGRPTGLRYGNLMGSGPLYSVDGRWLYVADQAGYAARHRATRKRLGPTYTDIDGSGLGVTPDGQHLITVDSERRLQCWRVPSPVQGTPDEVMRQIVERIGVEELDGQFLVVRSPERTAQAQIAPLPLPVTDYRELHNAELPALKKWFAELHQDFRPIHISVREGSDGTKFDAIAIDDGTGTGFEAHLALADRDGVHAPDRDADAMWPKSFAQEVCATYVAGGVYHRHHVWAKGASTHAAWHPLADFEKGLKEFRDRGLRPVGVVEYTKHSLFPIGGPADGHAWELHRDLTAAQVADKVADARKRRWRPTVVHRSRDEADRFVLVVVANPRDVPWEYRAPLTVKEYEAALAESAKRGLRPQYVQSWVDADNPVYSAVWVGDYQPPPKAELAPPPRAVK